MAEEENKKKGRLATAVLAGSALAIGSFAMGVPAAFADKEQDPAVVNQTPEATATDEIEMPSYELSTTKVEPGGSITVTGVDFTPDTVLDFKFETSEGAPTGIDIPAVTADGEGNINFVVHIPDDVEPGLYQLAVVDEPQRAHIYYEFRVTEEPTEDPTSEPTGEPTGEPTEDPTSEPTGEPTGEPTEGPTSEPTGEPTGEPTEGPTSEPTGEPTGEPTEGPTSEPTGEPTGEPTEGPTSEPTGEPTGEPTEDPTSDPSGEPTGEPTEDPTSDPTEQLEVELAESKLYRGDILEISGSGFTADAAVGLSWNPSAETTADAEGNISAEMGIPADTTAGEYVLTVTDEVTGAETQVDFEVLAVEPGLTIDPEEITVDDFMGDHEDGAGVNHAVVGLEPGSEITYSVSGPEGVNDFENTDQVSDEGTADFVIYAPESSNPAAYLGEYTTVVTFENQDGETGQLQGNFTVVDGSGGTGAGANDDQANPVGDAGDPVDLNGSDNLAKTGASNTQLGLIAGLLLAVGGALVVYTNRSRLFSRKH